MSILWLKLLQRPHLEVFFHEVKNLERSEKSTMDHGSRLFVTQKDTSPRGFSFLDKFHVIAVINKALDKW
jgi:hypothetical protein